MTSPSVAALLGVLVLCLPRPASADPVSTAWLEDVHLAAARGSETVLRYEHQSADLKATAEGYDELAVGLLAGVNRRLTLAPEFTVRQRGEEPLRLDDVGLRLRWLALDRFEWPALMLYGGYSNDLGESRDHIWVGGAAARYEIAWLFLNADVRPTLNLGGAEGTALETWYGLAVGYGRQTTWSVRAGLELFAVIPVKGERASDPTFGASADANTYYYGPSVALAGGACWGALSAVTGYGLSDGASQLMLRGMVGVAH